MDYSKTPCKEPRLGKLGRRLDSESSPLGQNLIPDARGMQIFRRATTPPQVGKAYPREALRPYKSVPAADCNLTGVLTHPIFTSRVVW